MKKTIVGLFFALVLSIPSFNYSMEHKKENTQEKKYLEASDIDSKIEEIKKKIKEEARRKQTHVEIAEQDDSPIYDLGIPAKQDRNALWCVIL